MWKWSPTLFRAAPNDYILILRNVHVSNNLQRNIAYQPTPNMMLGEVIRKHKGKSFHFLNFTHGTW